MVRASDSGSGDPGSILGRVGVFVSLSKRHLLPKSTGNTGNGSFRPRVVSALSRFGPGSFRPESFRPGSFRPWVVSAQFSGSFRPNFLQLSGLLPEVK